MPDSAKSLVSLAIDVVFPQPLTPQTMITVGPVSAKRMGSTGWAMSALSFFLTSSRTSAKWTTRPAKGRADGVHGLLGGLHSHIRLDKFLEEFIEKLVID